MGDEWTIGLEGRTAVQKVCRGGGGRAAAAASPAGQPRGPPGACSCFSSAFPATGVSERIARGPGKFVRRPNRP